MDHAAIRRITSRLWGPVCAVTAAHGGEVGGQIVVGVLSASILPEHPRLLIQVWKANRTHDLIAASRAFAVHPLAAEHAAIVRQLGFRSGHDGTAKLDGLEWSPGLSGSPILTAPPGFVECRVVGTLDATDMTVFLGAAIAGAWRGGETPLVPAYAMIGAMPAAWQEEYHQHDRAQREAAARLLGADDRMPQ
ncbi:MAG: flavin reductase family protein [Thermomicrobia bacterium]|nr:flavin reductase family protein [Thermomicrobia bacterium]MCA1724692.1 flavin reductase family protein [Thermomicrobia bacterium]